MVALYLACDGSPQHLEILNMVLVPVADDLMDTKSYLISWMSARLTT